MKTSKKTTQKKTTKKKIVKKKTLVKTAKKKTVKKKTLVKTAKKKTQKKSTKKTLKKKTQVKKTTKKSTKKKTTKKVKQKKASKKPVKKHTSLPEKEKISVTVDKPKELSQEDKTKQEAKEIIVQEIQKIKGNLPLEDFYNDIKNLDFFVSKNDECLEKSCENPSTTLGYCRFHYIKNWHDIKKKHSLINTGKLQTVVKSLLNKYSPKFIENVLSDLSDEKYFLKALKELGISETGELDDSYDDEGSEDQDIVYETKVTSKLIPFHEE